jgi:hypothetical protein
MSAFALSVQASSSGKDCPSDKEMISVDLLNVEISSPETFSDPPYPYYFSGFQDENDFCLKILTWADQVVNGYRDLENECFRKDFYIEKQCVLAGFDFATYYQPTNVLRLYKWFGNYTEANTAFTNFSGNFSKCEGQSNVFVNGITGIDPKTEAKVLRALKTQREIKSAGKRNVVTFQLIHKQYQDDYPAKAEVGYYIYYESRLE